MDLFLNISEPQEFLEGSQSYFAVPTLTFYESDTVPINLTLLQNNKSYAAVRPYDVLLPQAGETMSIAIGTTTPSGYISVSSQSMYWNTSSNAWTGSLTITGSGVIDIINNGYPWYLEVQSNGDTWTRTYVQRQVIVLPSVIDGFGGIF